MAKISFRMISDIRFYLAPISFVNSGYRKRGYKRSMMTVITIEGIAANKNILKFLTIT